MDGYMEYGNQSLSEDAWTMRLTASFPRSSPYTIKHL